MVIRVIWGQKLKDPWWLLPRPKMVVPPLTSAAYEASLEVQKDLLSFVIDATMQMQLAIWWCSNMEDVKDELWRISHHFIAVSQTSLTHLYGAVAT